MSTTIDAKDLRKLADKIHKAVAERPDRVAGILRKHGGLIEQKARAITPVDTGLLARKNESRVAQFEGYVSLTIENNQHYAPYQHYKVLNHTQPNARDHFISLPFYAELPAMCDDIINTDIEAFQ